ncbi:MAG: 4'-phosphopantetheinyl transferase family protein [Paludibacter sp.]
MIHSKLHTAGADILIWEVTETETELLSLLSNFDIYKSEYEQLKSAKRKLEFLAARVALNTLTGFEINVQYTPEGKPICANADLQISISHSGKWIAVITHTTKMVGIDIELPTDKFQKLYQRFLNKKEQNILFCATDLRKVQLAWSAKEALYKIIGSEAVNFDKQLEIMDFTINNSGSFTGIHTVSNKKYTLHYTINEAFNLVYCVNSMS